MDGLAVNWSGPTTDDGNSTNMHWRIVGSSGRGVRSGYAHMREQIRWDVAFLDLGGDFLLMKSKFISKSRKGYRWTTNLVFYWSKLCPTFTIKLIKQ